MNGIPSCSVSLAGSALSRFVLAGCFAGLVLFFGNASALGDPAHHGSAQLAAVQEPAAVRPALQPEPIRPARPLVAISITRLRLAGLGPEAFADWGVSDPR